MRRALRRAGWALAAGIGMTAQAVAQAPHGPIAEPGGHVTPADETGVAHSGATLVLTEGQARLEEGQVELAFLADPMLFAYGLGAHVQGGALEVRGYVPNEAVREQALRVATAQSGLHVLDRMKLHPTLAGHASVDKPDNITRAARALLEESFPEHGKALEVRCDARGHVTVSGLIGSYEDKVLASRKLRQVPGCSCVVNQLTLAAAPHEVHPLPMPKPITTGAAVTEPPATRPQVTKWEPSPAPVAPRPTVTPARKENEPPALAMPRVHTDPAPLPQVAGPEIKPQPPAKRVVPPVPANDVPLPEIAPAPKRTTVAQPVIDVPPMPAAPDLRRPAPPPVVPVAADKAPAPKPMTTALPVIETAPLPPAPDSRRPTPLPVTPEVAPAPKPAPLPVVTPDSRRPVLPPVTPPALPDKAPAAKSPMTDVPPLPAVAPQTTPAPKPAPATPPKTEVAPLPAAPEPPRTSQPPVTAPATKLPAPDVPPLPVVAPESRRPVPASVAPPALPDKAPAAKPAIDVPPLPGTSESRRPSALPPVATTTPKPSADKHTAGRSEESYVSEGTITFADDPPSPAKPPAPAPAKPAVPEKVTVPQKPAATVTTPTPPAPTKPAVSPPPGPLPLPPVKPLSAAPAPSATPPKPVEGTLWLDPPPAPKKPQTVQASPTVKPLAPPAPAAPARPSATPAMRLKDRVQAVCGPAYEIQVTTPPGKTGLQVTITAKDEAEGKRLMDQITPILRSAEFLAQELNVEVVYPAPSTK